MNTWWMRAERAVADTIGRGLDRGGNSITWNAEINSSPRSEPVVVTGHVDDLNAFNALAQRLVAARNIRGASEEVSHVVA